jgi:exoribonuclease R
MGEPSQTEDRRVRKGITIDSPTTRDMDDAIWLEVHGTYATLSVSVADVASAVEIGSEMDALAQKRAFTRYGAQHTDWMLPLEVTEQTCSLRPGVATPAWTIDINITPRMTSQRDDEVVLTFLQVRPTLLHS